MTMYDGRTNLSRQVVEEVAKHFPEQLYQAVIPRTIRIGESPSYGRTIYEHDANGSGSLSYQNFCEEFLSRRSDLSS
jgi:chromosome partitioning protein